jgi:outer membrane protein assembly factor BamB
MRIVKTTCAVLSLASFALLIAADWPEWRGPKRDGTLNAEPKAWPEKLKLKWKIDVGEGHSSPILAGGSVYAFARQNGQEIVYAVDPASGKARWKQQYPAPYKMNPVAVSHGEGPKSTTTYANGSLYTLQIIGILSSFDAETGKLGWQKEFSKQYKATAPAAGSAMSPLVDRGLLIIGLGTDDDGAITAFDATTGAVKWSFSADGTAYSSPLIFESGGVRQVIGQSKANVIGLDEATGKLLWKIPFATRFEQNIVTNVVYKDTLIYSGQKMGVFAIRLVHKGNEWSTQEVWKNTDFAMHLNSPVLTGNLLFGFSHRNKGQLFCLDADTGKKLWTGPPRDADNAALLVSPSSLIELKNGGELVVAKPSAKSFDVVRRYTVADSETWAHPVVMADGLLVQDAKTLARWSVE